MLLGLCFIIKKARVDTIQMFSISKNRNKNWETLENFSFKSLLKICTRAKIDYTVWSRKFSNLVTRFTILQKYAKQNCYFSCNQVIKFSGSHYTELLWITVIATYIRVQQIFTFGVQSVVFQCINNFFKHSFSIS